MRVLELHMAMSPVQRSAGRSSVGAAAYISGSKLIDERTAKPHDYQDKPGVELTGIALSDQAPEWAHDRSKLWNAAEQREKHPRAQTARSMIVNMPHEFKPEHRQEAATRIAHVLAQRYRGAVDYALHHPNEEGDHRNHHGHFLLTARPFENGRWAEKKDRVLDDLKKGPEEYKALRQLVAGTINDIAVREKLPIYVEHLSFKDRGLEREPTKHLGAGAMAKERRGQATERGEENRAIEARNAQREEIQSESNVVNFEIAKELAERKRRGMAPPITREAAFGAFYRDTYNRRAAMLETFEREHGRKEQEARAEAVRLQQSINGSNILMRAWRILSGRTRQEKQELAGVTATLDEIKRQKDEAQARFEADRRTRLETLQRQLRQEQEEFRQAIEQELARAAGDEHRTSSRRAIPRPRTDSSLPLAQKRPAEPVERPAASPPTHPAPESEKHPRVDYAARRDAFFARTRRSGLKTTREPEAEIHAEARKTPSPTLANDDATAKARPNYEQRRDAFLARTRRRSTPAPKHELDSVNEQRPKALQESTLQTEKVDPPNRSQAALAPGQERSSGLALEGRHVAVMEQMGGGAEPGFDEDGDAEGEDLGPLPG